MIRGENKRWLISLLTITAIIIVSIALIIAGWERPYSITSGLLGWFHIASFLTIVVLYFWYLLIISSVLPRLLKVFPSTFKNKKYLYSIFVTILSLIIGEAYSNLIWNVEITRHPTGETEIETVAAVGTHLQILLLVVPFAMLGLAAFSLSYAYINLNKKQSAIAGAVIALLSPFWLVLLFS